MKKVLVFLICFFSSLNCVFANHIVMDINSERIFYQENMNEKRLIASTTKIMTAILAIESNKLENVVKVGEEVLKMYGSNIYIEMNENMLLLDLIYGLLLRSGNDAAVVIANYLESDETKFVEKMNLKAKELGMTNTIFNNPHGLDEETKNYSTPYDLAILYSYAYKNKTFKKIIGTKNYVSKSDKKTYEWKNKNKLLFLYNKTTGGKTGYTPLAGRILVSSASNNDLELCIVTFDRDTYKYDFHKEKYEKVFNEYKNYKLLDKNNFNVVGIDEKIYIKESFYYPLTEEERNLIKIKTNILRKDNLFGEVYVYLEDELLIKKEIYLKKQSKNIFDKIKEFFNKLAFTS